MTRARLQAACTAARGHDYHAARDAVIAAWRLRRSPVLAELGAVLATRAPDALSAALAALVTPRSASTLGNLHALERVDDPRLAAFAHDALVRLPFTARAAIPLLTALVRTAKRHGDPRLASRAPAIETAIRTRIKHASTRDSLLASVARVVAAIPRVRPPSAREAELERELVARLEPLRTTDRRTAALLAEIYASPEDDAPRLVYADLLTAQGDPRGELIVLQIARARAGVAEPGAREAWLLQRHGRAWLGDLAPALAWGTRSARTELRRGFVATADLAAGAALAPVARSDAWATVEAFREDPAHAYLSLLPTAPLRALRVLHVGMRPIADFVPHAAHLVGVAHVTLREPVAAAALREAFAGLRSLSGRVPELSLAALAAWAACGGPNLELLELVQFNAPVAAEPSRRAQLAAFARALVGTPAHVARLRLVLPFVRAQPPLVLDLRRAADGRYERA